MDRHTLWMIAGCTLPLLLIFLLPLFGVQNQVAFAAFIILMLVCHLIMLGGHGHGEEEQHHHDTKGRTHESH